ncbi:MAG: metallophosphoesterase family protein [Saprospiraceae bacterium]|nr:metallophosphoesterase family protein [Saprospiraceae bacterium]MBK7812152.1 metallophosphoesterase family protein [Saprospiraceae bacterium]MBK9632632.1 metallophosphoesterase family protein [Saprospiraceae bacterium]
MRIGLLSDTHSYIDHKLEQFFFGVDQIWHAGDLGDIKVYDYLKSLSDVKLVYGNIDDSNVRQHFTESLILEIEGMIILMIHIAGSLGNYNQLTRKLINEHKPNILVCGHSHILKIAFDHKYNLLYVNPGAYGIHGFHLVRTALRFEINSGNISKMEIFEQPRKKIKIEN